jgi:hypothetical protein
MKRADALRLARGVYTLAVLIVGVRYFVKGVVAFFGWPWHLAARWDCGVDWGAAKLFYQGISPYSPEGLQATGLEGYGFGHPPTTPFWFLPLTEMGWPQAAQLIGVASLVALGVLIGLSASQLRLWAPIPTTILVLGLLLQVSWMYDHILIVQISAIIACLLVLAWYCLGRNRDYSAGFCLGIACTLKLFPGVLVLYCALTRRWRAVAAAGAIYLFVAGVMTARFGLSSWRAFFKQQGPIAHFWADYPRNASLHGIILRIFRPACERPYVNGFAGVRDLAQMPSMPPMKGASLATAAAALLFLLCCFLVVRAPKTRAAFDLSMAMFIVLATFINPWIWEHYNVVLVMPMFVALVEAWRRWVERRAAWADGALGRNRFFVSTLGALVALALLGFVVWTFHIDMYLKETLYGSVWEKKNANLPVPRFLHRDLHLYEFFNWAPWPIVLGILMMLLATMNGARSPAWLRRVARKVTRRSKAGPTLDTETAPGGSPAAP